MPRLIEGLALAVVTSLLSGCPRAGQPLDAGIDAAGDGGGYDPVAGNSFRGALLFDDERVMHVDRSTLGAGASPCRPPVLARVTQVIDGDTLHVSGVSEIGELQVRLIGIDTPEIAHDTTPAECFGPEARAFTGMLEGKLVWLTFDTDCDDTFGRTLAYVWIGSGAGDLWQRQLLRRGFARTLVVPPNTTYSGIFEMDRAVAAGDGAGLWSACP